MRKNRDGRVFSQQQGDGPGAPTHANAGAPPDAARATPHSRRTVGPTEQRLREANQQSWMATRAGWAKMVRRFMPGGKR